MKVTKHGAVYQCVASWAGDDFFIWREGDSSPSVDYVKVCDHALEFELLTAQELNAAKIGALNAAKQKAMADFQKMVTDIDRQISRLTAIENVVTA